MPLLGMESGKNPNNRALSKDSQISLKDLANPINKNTSTQTLIVTTKNSGDLSVTAYSYQQLQKKRENQFGQNLPIMTQLPDPLEEFKKEFEKKHGISLPRISNVQSPFLSTSKPSNNKELTNKPLLDSSLDALKLALSKDQDSQNFLTQEKIKKIAAQNMLFIEQQNSALVSANSITKPGTAQDIQVLQITNGQQPNQNSQNAKPVIQQAITNGNENKPIGSGNTDQEKKPVAAIPPKTEPKKPNPIWNDLKPKIGKYVDPTGVKQPKRWSPPMPAVTKPIFTIEQNIPYVPNATIEDYFPLGTFGVLKNEPVQQGSNVLNSSTNDGLINSNNNQQQTKKLIPWSDINKQILWREKGDLFSFFKNVSSANQADLKHAVETIVDGLEQEEYINEQKRALVPDSIESSGNWENVWNGLTEENKKNLQTVGIRQIHRYIPTNSKLTDDNEKIVMVVTHGTWGSGTTNYFEYTDENDKVTEIKKIKENPNYRHIKRFATWYGYAQKKAVDLLSMKWSGGLSDSARFEGATYLNNYLQKNYNKNAQLVFLSHSHGCNIINNVSTKLGKPIDLIVHFACPNRNGQTEYQPTNFNKLVYFHSDNDLTARLGRFKENDVFNYLLRNAALFGATKVKSEDCANIARMLFNTSLLFPIERATKKFMDNHYFPPQDNAVVIGLRTKINDEAPGHGYVTDVAQVLPELFTKIYRNYPAHVGRSFNADLSVRGDGNHNYSSSNPIVISNLQVAADHKLPKAIPYVTFNASHIKNRKDLAEHNAKHSKNDLKSINLDGWLEQNTPQVPSNQDILVKPNDNLGCMVTISDVHNQFNNNDIDHERNIASHDMH